MFPCKGKTSTVWCKVLNQLLQSTYGPIWTHLYFVRVESTLDLSPCESTIWRPFWINTSCRNLKRFHGRNLPYSVHSCSILTFPQPSGQLAIPVVFWNSWYFMSCWWRSNKHSRFTQRRHRQREHFQHVPSWSRNRVLSVYIREHMVFQEQAFSCEVLSPSS